MAAHRYWRVYVNTTNGDAFARIGELEFRVNSGGTNLCTGGTPTKTGEFVSSGDNSALAGFDGNSATAWASNDGAGRGLGYDIVTPADVGFVRITARNDGFGPAGAPQDFDIKYSDDDVTYTLAWNVTGQTGWAAGEVRDFNTPIVPTDLNLIGGGASASLTGTVENDGPLAVSVPASVAMVGVINVVGTMEVSVGPASLNLVAGEVTDNPYRLGKREVKADFNGIRTSNISITKRPDAVSFDYLVAFTMGPVTRGDTTSGITDRAWYVRADNNDSVVYLARENTLRTGWDAEVVLFSFTGAQIEEIDVAFEQSGNIVVTAERKTGAASAKEIWLYWFKPAASAFVFEMFAAGRTPRILLDNPPDITNSDVQLFYLAPGVGLVYREQRELYANVHTTPHTVETNWYLEDAFYTLGWRVGLLLVQHNVGGTYAAKRLESTLMPIYLSGLESPIVLHGTIADSQLRTVLFVFTDDVDTYPSKAGIAARDDYLELTPSFGEDLTLREVLLFADTYDRDDLSLFADFHPALSSLIETGGTFIDEVLYDPEEMTVSPSFGSGHTLAAVLIENVLYDKDGATLSTSFGTGGTLA